LSVPAGQRARAAEDNLARKGDSDGEVSAELVEKAGVMGSEVPWKEWNWPSRGWMGALRRDRCASMAPGEAAYAMLVLAERPKRKYWLVRSERMISCRHY